MATTMCPSGTTTESRTHMVGECKIYKENWDASEEGMMKLDVCEIEGFRRLESSSDKTIAILEDRLWLQKAKMDGNRTRNSFYVTLKNLQYIPAVRSKISSKLIFASWVLYSDRAFY